MPRSAAHTESWFPNQLDPAGVANETANSPGNETRRGAGKESEHRQDIQRRRIRKGGIEQSILGERTRRRY